MTEKSACPSNRHSPRHPARTAQTRTVPRDVRSSAALVETAADLTVPATTATNRCHLRICSASLNRIAKKKCPTSNATSTANAAPTREGAAAPNKNKDPAWICTVQCTRGNGQRIKAPGVEKRRIRQAGVAFEAASALLYSENHALGAWFKRRRMPKMKKEHLLL